MLSSLTHPILLEEKGHQEAVDFLRNYLQTYEGRQQHEYVREAVREMIKQHLEGIAYEGEIKMRIAAAEQIAGQEVIAQYQQQQAQQAQAVIQAASAFRHANESISRPEGTRATLPSEEVPGKGVRVGIGKEQRVPVGNQPFGGRPVGTLPMGGGGQVGRGTPGRG
jgi:hypothetical protein